MQDTFGQYAYQVVDLECPSVLICFGITSFVSNIFSQRLTQVQLGSDWLL